MKVDKDRKVCPRESRCRKKGQVLEKAYYREEQDQKCQSRDSKQMIGGSIFLLPSDGFLSRLLWPLSRVRYGPMIGIRGVFGRDKKGPDWLSPPGPPPPPHSLRSLIVSPMLDILLSVKGTVSQEIFFTLYFFVFPINRIKTVLNSDSISLRYT